MTYKVIGICVVYMLVQLLVLQWGIPNANHPFTYHMDEWHQLQAVRDTFVHGTPNMEGAANGTMLQFILSGVFVSPFVLLHIINPSGILSSMDNITMQHRLFEILRLDTLLFGTLSIIVLAYIMKKYFRSFTTVTLILFVFSPVWIELSNFFKYDIALTFWILLSTYMLLKYISTPSPRNFYAASIVSALALATKISAIPQVGILIFAFLFFTPEWKKHMNILWKGMGTFVIVLLLFGIPDIIFRWQEYIQFIQQNVVVGTLGDSNYILGMPKLIYLLFVDYPNIFGHIFYVLFLAGAIYWAVRLIHELYRYRKIHHRNELLILVSFIGYAVSLTPLGLGATGNRMLVLLPFFSILAGSFLFAIRPARYSALFFSIITVLLFLQTQETSQFIVGKLVPSAQEISSVWIRSHIPKGSTIGIENIPIYQSLPDIVLQEFYDEVYHKSGVYMYTFSVINSKTKYIPSYIVITNGPFESNYLKISDKKLLIRRLLQTGYSVVYAIRPYEGVYSVLGNDENYQISGLAQTFPITIYERK